MIDSQFEQMAQLMIRLAGILTWAIKHERDYQDVVDSGRVAWDDIKERGEE
jgi:hypothetical protein